MKSIETMHVVLLLLVELYGGRKRNDVVESNGQFFSSFSGIIREGESYLVGPLLDGRFLPATIKTIHRYRVPRRMVRAGQSASLSLLNVGGSRLRKVIQN